MTHILGFQQRLVIREIYYRNVIGNILNLRKITKFHANLSPVRDLFVHFRPSKFARLIGNCCRDSSIYVNVTKLN